MTSLLGDNIESTSIIISLDTREIPKHIHNFINPLGISDDSFVNIIKDCIKYLKENGTSPTDLSVRNIVDIEEPEHKYLRILFILPINNMTTCIKLQAQFYTDKYHDIIQKHLGSNINALERFRRSVNLVFDILS